MISASTDCTARLWTLSGEQVGLFGQEAGWQLDKRETWLDRSRCIAGSANEGEAARTQTLTLTLTLTPTLSLARTRALALTLTLP